MFYHQCADIGILVSVKIHMLLLLVACNAYAPAIFFPAALVASTCVPSNQPPDHHLSFFLGHLSFPAQTRHCSFCLVFLPCPHMSVIFLPSPFFFVIIKSVLPFLGACLPLTSHGSHDSKPNLLNWPSSPGTTITRRPYETTRDVAQAFH